MDDAPEPAPALWNGAGRDCFRSDARVEPEAYAGTAAGKVIPGALERRAGQRRSGEETDWQQVIPAAKQYWRAFAQVCARLLLRWKRKHLPAQSLSRYRIRWSASSRSAKRT